MSAQQLLDIINTAATAVGADGSLVVELAEAFEGIGRGTLVLAGSYAGGALGKDPPCPSAVEELTKELVAHVGSSFPDNATSRTLVLHVAIALGEHCRGLVTRRSGVPRGGKDTDDKEGEAGTDAYKDLTRLQNVSMPISRQCQFVGAARLSVLKHGYIQSIPSLSAVTLRGCANTGKRPLGEGVALAVDNDIPQRTTTIQMCYGLTKTVVMAWVATYTVPCAPTDFGGGEEGWVPCPGRASQIRLCCTVAAGNLLIDHFVGSALQDPPAYVRMFNHVMSHLIDTGGSLEVHPVRAINKLCAENSGLFHKDPNPGEGADASSRRAAEAASPATEKATRDTKAVCKSWLDNGNCKDYDADACGYSHPAALRNASRNQSSQKRSRANNGGGGGGNAGGSANWGGGWNQGWGQWHPPPNYGWHGSGSGKGGGKGGGKGSKGGGKGGGKGNSWGRSDWDWW